MGACAPEKGDRPTERIRLTIRADQDATRQITSTWTGMSSFTGIESSDGRSILKVESVAGIVPVISMSAPCAMVR